MSVTNNATVPQAAADAIAAEVPCTSPGQPSAAELPEIESPKKPVDPKLLGRLERKVDKGLSSYYPAGLALAQIQQERLWPKDKKFAEYVEERFGEARHVLYRIKRAAEIARILDEAGLPIPAVVGQAHLLHEAFRNQSPEKLIEVWREVLCRKKRPTMGTIEAVLKEMKAPSEATAPEGEVDLDSGRTAKTEASSRPEAELPVPRLREVVNHFQAVENDLRDGLVPDDELAGLVEIAERHLNSLKQRLAAVAATGKEVAA